MSIRINADLEYLLLKLNISTSKIEMYREKSINEIVELEAAEGNQEAINFAADLFTDPSSLIELFQLADPQNKLVIINAMSSKDVVELIPMLENDDLVQGLQFFTQDSILNLLNEIPKEEFIKVVFQLFSEQDVITLMPANELNKLLTGEVDKDFLLENLKTLPQMYLQQMLESVTGEEAKGNSTELALKIGQLGDLAYKNAIKNLQSTPKRELTFMLTNADNKLYERFDTGEYLKIVNREREKDEIVKSMGIIKPEHLQRMMTQLPQDLLNIVLTQIDTQKFADNLIHKHPEILAQFVAG
ncbi:MAG: hypothetical protein E7Z87_04685 [Cyanobacteria bacterium SIG26]|nr:hypothetical protein [Cyanobacteria bacterium SIG26]